VSAPERTPWPGQLKADASSTNPLPLVVGLLCLLAPPALGVWLGGVAALRLAPAVRRWHLGAAAGAVALATMAVGGATAAVERHFWLWTTVGTLFARTGSLDGVLSLLGTGVARTVPLGIAVGLAAAAVNPPGRELVGQDDARAARAAARQRKRAGRLATRAPMLRDAPPALAVSLGGDLDRWRAGPYVVLPPDVARLPRLVIGAPGGGKSVYLCREAYLAGLAGRQLVVLDGKGDRGFADEITAAYRAGWAQCGAGRPAVVLRFPDEPLDIWRGGPQAVVNKLLTVWHFEGTAEWYGEVAELALRLALHAPGPPVRSGVELARRMQPGELARLWAGHVDELALAESVKDKLDGPSVRLGNLVASMGGMLDGSRSFEDTDLTIVSLPTMGQARDADAIFRVLMADLGHWAVHRKPPRGRALVVVDEFSAISGGRMAAIHLLERGRSAGVPVVLAAQSRTSLGQVEEVDRLIGAAAAVVLFATPEPEDLVKLAGTVRGPDAVYQVEEGRLTGRASVAMRAATRVDANAVRALRPGEAFILAGGRAERVFVIRNTSAQRAAGELEPPPPPGLPDRRADGFPTVPPSPRAVPRPNLLSPLGDLPARRDER
jgi:hypothetical protein